MYPDSTRVRRAWACFCEGIWMKVTVTLSVTGKKSHMPLSILLQTFLNLHSLQVEGQTPLQKHTQTFSVREHHTMLLIFCPLPEHNVHSCVITLFTLSNNIRNGFEQIHSCVYNYEVMSEMSVLCALPSKATVMQRYKDILLK